MADSKPVSEQDLIKGLFTGAQSSPDLATAKTLTTPRPSR